MTEPRLDATRTVSELRSWYRAPSSGEMSSVSPCRKGESYPALWTPVLYESSRRPVVRRIGYSSLRVSHRRMMFDRW